MSKTLNTTPKTPLNIREVFCFALLFIGLMIILTPVGRPKTVTAQNTTSVKTVVSPQVAASNTVAVVKKKSWLLGRFHFGSVTH